MKITGLRILLLVPIVGLFFPLCLRAHHEAIFGPQSSTLISRKRFVSTQYYLTNEGRRPAPKGRSHIGILSVGIPVGERWSVSITLPIEAERGEEERATGVQDIVAAIRYSPQLGGNRWLMTVLTVEPPTGSLEHRALGVGGGAVFGNEWRDWSAIVYGLGRTESSLESGEKRGDRVFLGGGVAYEKAALPFSPQLGLSWEHTGRRLKDNSLDLLFVSNVLMLHPTVTKSFGDSLQTFFVVSVPVAQWSGAEGWQRLRVAAGMVWSF